MPVPRAMVPVLMPKRCALKLLSAVGPGLQERCWYPFLTIVFEIGVFMRSVR